LPASSKLQVMNKKVSFADRVLGMQAAVASLLDVLAVVEREAAAMAEAQKRFAARKPAQKRQAKSAE
jgi:stringent starvation protein B